MAISRRNFLRGLGAGALGVMGAGCTIRQMTGTIPGKRPNIVMFFTDELDLSYLGCYGGHVPTPHIDAIADKGVRFDQAYCVSPMCVPTRYTVLTGNYPGRYLAPRSEGKKYGVMWNTWIDDETVCLPRVLGGAGYYTGFSGKWHNGFASSRADWEMPKFDKANDDPRDPEVDAKLREHQRIEQERLKQTAGFDFVGSVMGNTDQLPLRALNYHHVEWITQGALDFLDSAAGREEPFFLYAAVTITHGPDHARGLDDDPRYTPGGFRAEGFDCHPPRSNVRERLEAAGLEVDHVSAGMTMLDDHVACVLQKLQDIGADRDTLVLFCADHGVEPGKATCYQAGVHVPMLARWPGVLPAGYLCNEPVSYTDVLPSLAAVAGAPAPKCDGRAFLPALPGPGDWASRPLYFEAGVGRGVLLGRYKYIAVRHTDEAIAKMKNGEVDIALDWAERTNQGHCSIAISCYPHYFDPDQLYDLVTDPYEVNNLAGDPAHADALAQMRSLLREKLDGFEAPFSLDVPEFIRSDEYARLVEARQRIGASRIGWWPQDYRWPPTD